MDSLELEDIQGYIIRGYAHMQYSRFALLKVSEPMHAKQFIRDIADKLTVAVHVSQKEKLPPTCLNIAFTAPGLAALGMSDENLRTFNPAFREGMVTSHRQRILGDFDSSAPNFWRWGGVEYNDSHKNHNYVHAVLMIFGKDKDTCMKYYEELKNAYTAGFTEVEMLDGQTLPKNREHFGFRDGISQPVIKGSGRLGPAHNIINAGEFILGYKNEYNVYPDTPLLNAEQGDMNLLHTDAEGSGKKDLGRNGSYLVIRQLEQDVNLFWSFMNDRTKNADGSINEAESTRLAAKMMGRWPGGAPVSLFPEKDPGNESDENDFGYAKSDPDGLKCPFGSHLRRTNPRDSFEDDGIRESWSLSNKHRIIRRARLYGDPHVGSPTNTKPSGEVGLIFNCFNADLSRQFEMVQYTWANSPKVKQLYNDPDPIIGVRETPHDGLPQNFTIQACPVNKTIKDLKRFITVRGGAYFFFPSITSVRYLATI